MRRWTAFCAEVRIGRQISHPNVCRVYDIVELAEHHFIAMEYIDGEDLASLLRRIGRLPPEKAVSIARDICAGIAAAHDRGIVHRDLKPANIMVDGCGRAIVADFGLAAIGDELRGVHSTSGTPAYMSPEQFAGSRVTARSDIYALGLILYEIFTGRRLYTGTTVDEIREAHAVAKSRPSSIVKEIDPAIERMILRCIEEDPAQRIGSVHTLIGALPGGDALSAAIAAGETPAPDVVAAAGMTGDLSNSAAWSLCTAAIVALLLGAWVSSQFTVVGMVTDIKSRDALTDRAREVEHAFGYPKPHDEVVEFASNQPFLRSIASKAGREKWTAIGDSSVSPLHFVYRGSPTALVSRDINGLVGPNDPPETIETMSTIVLDHLGRLRSFRAVPPERMAATGAAAFDWRRAFELAELDIRSFTPVTPLWTPPYGFDQRVAWSGTYPDRKDIAIRVEAASLAGKPVFFRIVEPWTTPLSSPRRPPLGLSHVRHPDLRRVRRRSGHCTSKPAERPGRPARRSAHWRGHAGSGLPHAGLLGTPRYRLPRRMGVAPADRGHCSPAWNHRGHPLSRGRAVRAAAGATAAHRLEPPGGRPPARPARRARRDDRRDRRGADRGAVPRRGSTVGVARPGESASAQPADRRGDAHGPRVAIDDFEGVMMAIITTIVMLALIVIFALITRSYGVAVLLTVLAVATTTITGNVPFVVNIAQLSITVFVLYRFGAVAFAACALLRNALFYTPFTLDASAWFAPRGVAMLLLITGLMVAALRISVAGKPLFRDTMLEEQPAI